MFMLSRAKHFYNTRDSNFSTAPQQNKNERSTGRGQKDGEKTLDLKASLSSDSLNKVEQFGLQHEGCKQPNDSKNIQQRRNVYYPVHAALIAPNVVAVRKLTFSPNEGTCENDAYTIKKMLDLLHENISYIRPQYLPKSEFIKRKFSGLEDFIKNVFDAQRLGVKPKESSSIQAKDSPPTVSDNSVAPVSEVKSLLYQPYVFWDLALSSDTLLYRLEGASIFNSQILNFHIFKKLPPPLHLITSFCSSIMYWLEMNESDNFSVININEPTFSTFLLLASLGLSLQYKNSGTKTNDTGQKSLCASESNCSTQNVPVINTDVSDSDFNCLPFLTNAEMIGWKLISEWPMSFQRYLTYFRYFLQSPEERVPRSSPCYLTLRNLSIEAFPGNPEDVIFEIYVMKEGSDNVVENDILNSDFLKHNPYSNNVRKYKKGARNGHKNGMRRDESPIGGHAKRLKHRVLPKNDIGKQGQHATKTRDIVSGNENNLNSVSSDCELLKKTNIFNEFTNLFPSDMFQKILNRDLYNVMDTHKTSDNASVVIDLTHDLSGTRKYTIVNGDVIFVFRSTLRGGTDVFATYPFHTSFTNSGIITIKKCDLDILQGYEFISNDLQICLTFEFSFSKTELMEKVGRISTCDSKRSTPGMHQNEMKVTNLISSIFRRGKNLSVNKVNDSNLDADNYIPKKKMQSFGVNVQPFVGVNALKFDPPCSSMYEFAVRHAVHVPKRNLDELTSLSSESELKCIVASKVCQNIFLPTMKLLDSYLNSATLSSKSEDFEDASCVSSKNSAEILDAIAYNLSPSLLPAQCFNKEEEDFKHNSGSTVNDVVLDTSAFQSQILSILTEDTQNTNNRGQPQASYGKSKIKMRGLFSVEKSIHLRNLPTFSAAHCFRSEINPENNLDTKNSILNSRETHAESSSLSRANITLKKRIQSTDDVTNTEKINLEPSFPNYPCYQNEAEQSSDAGSNNCTIGQNSNAINNSIQSSTDKATTYAISSNTVETGRVAVETELHDAKETDKAEQEKTELSLQNQNLMVENEKLVQYIQNSECKKSGSELLAQEVDRSTSKTEISTVVADLNDCANPKVYSVRLPTGQLIFLSVPSSGESSNVEILKSSSRNDDNTSTEHSKSKNDEFQTTEKTADAAQKTKSDNKFEEADLSKFLKAPADTENIDNKKTESPIQKPASNSLALNIRKHQKAPMPKGLPPAKAACKPRGHLPLGRKIHWKPLAIDKIEGTVFSEMTTSTEAIKDLVDLNVLNRVFSSDRKSIKLPFKNENTLRTVLDSRRAQNVAIVLSRLSRPLDELALLLQELQIEKMCMDDIDKLSQILPQPNEIKLFESFAKSNELFNSLRDIEKQYYSLAILDRVQERVMVTKLAFQLELMEGEYDYDLELMQNAVSEARSSYRFRVLLLAVLQWGNYVNHGVSKIRDMRTPGFTLSSLFKLMEFKSTLDGSITSLHYIILNLMVTAPELQIELLPTDMPHLIKASKVGFESIKNVLQSLSSDLEVVKAQLDQPILCEGSTCRLNDILKLGKQKYSCLMTKYKEALRDVKELKTYFGEESAASESPEDIFVILADVLEYFKSCSSELLATPKKFLSLLIDPRGAKDIFVPEKTAHNGIGATSNLSANDMRQASPNGNDLSERLDCIATINQT